MSNKDEIQNIPEENKKAWEELKKRGEKPLVLIDTREVRFREVLRQETVICPTCNTVLILVEKKPFYLSPFSMPLLGRTEEKKKSDKK